MDGSLTQCGAHSVDRIDGRALLLAGRSVMLLFAMMRVGLLVSAHTVALRASVRISTTCFGMGHSHPLHVRKGGRCTHAQVQQAGRWLSRLFVAFTSMLVHMVPMCVVS